MTKTTMCWVAITVGSLALAGCSHETADWRSASAANTAEAYQQFLQQHPSSTNAAQAKTRLEQLADDHDWQVAAAANNRDAYQQFVAQHPDSKWTQEARIRIENFAQSGASGAAASASTPSAAAVVASAPIGAAAKAATPPSAARVHGVKNTATHKLADAQRAHVVQLGAYRSRERAQSQWKTLSARFPSELKSLQPRYVAGQSKQGHVYRLQVAVSSATGAKGLCATMKKHSQACVPVTA